jgi:hypothetical protein
MNQEVTGSSLPCLNDEDVGWKWGGRPCYRGDNRACSDKMKTANSRLVCDSPYLFGVYRAEIKKSDTIYVQRLKLIPLDLVRDQFDLAGYLVIIARDFAFIHVDPYRI